ncbi:hypothetical protein A0128_05830 [Leptospira tipperaryensis]|uniref:Phage neck terminator protein gp12-like domain-containing protein n=1 Tax=Leptospira tipperaryensis TaxID=2564040 RepID=A0A1D7UUX8_9LEPT|nr:hypothetical protein [Leptospira tipperaryensis]AOP33406.1 hypothetical protein A0128_05830 [Leptospira tipperaryensis]
MKFEYIESVMNKMVLEILKPDPPISMILADQIVTSPVYPYGTYKVLELTQDSSKNASKWIQKIDSESFKEISRKNQKTLISVSFLHDDSIATCWDLCEKAMDWFDSLDGLIECEKFGATPDVVSISVQDKTVLTDANVYEYKAGFDLLLKSRKYSEKQGESTASAPTVEFQEEA